MVCRTENSVFLLMVQRPVDTNNIERLVWVTCYLGHLGKSCHGVVIVHSSSFWSGSGVLGASPSSGGGGSVSSPSVSWSGSGVSSFGLSRILALSFSRMSPRRFLPGSFFSFCRTSFDQRVTPPAHLQSFVHSTSLIPSDSINFFL